LGKEGGEGVGIWGKYMSRAAKISFASSAQASKARDSERTRVLSQSKRRVVILIGVLATYLLSGELGMGRGMEWWGKWRNGERTLGGMIAVAFSLVVLSMCCWCSYMLL
jgi:hypothetical protein